mgnify:CR=1 FL=1
MSQVDLHNYDKLSAISFTDSFRGEFILYYMSDKLSEEDALLEMECYTIGGHNPDLAPYYIVIPKVKNPILQRIRANIYHQAYEEGSDAGYDTARILAENDVM